MLPCQESAETDAPPLAGPGQNLLIALQFEQVGFGFQAAAESGQFAGCTDYAMARNDDGNRIVPVGSSDRSCRSWIAELPRQLPVAPRLSKRNRQQRLPHVVLKFGTHQIQLQRKRLSLPLEVLVQLPFRFEKNGMIVIFHKRA